MIGLRTACSWFGKDQAVRYTVAILPCSSSKSSCAGIAVLLSSSHASSDLQCKHSKRSSGRYQGASTYLSPPQLRSSSRQALMFPILSNVMHANMLGRWWRAGATGLIPAHATAVPGGQ